MEYELNTTGYNDKSFVVWGNSTKQYKEQLKTLGGKFNGRLKEKEGFPGGAGWIFRNDSFDRVTSFINDVKEGNFTNDLPRLGDDNFAFIPNSLMPKNDVYQLVKYRIYKPEKGNKVKLKIGDEVSEGEVLQVETHKDIVDTVYISIKGGTSKAVIVNGYWKIHGFTREHSLFFD